MGKFSTILRASLTDCNKVQPQRVTTSRSAACLPQPQAPSACPVQAGSGDADVKRITSRMFQETGSEHEKMMNGLIMELSWNYHSWKHVPGEFEWFGNGLSTEFETLRPVPVSPLPSTSSCSPARVPDSWSALHSSCVSAPGTEANDEGSQIWGLSAMLSNVNHIRINVCPNPLVSQCQSNHVPYENNV